MFIFLFGIAIGIAIGYYGRVVISRYTITRKQ